LQAAILELQSKSIRTDLELERLKTTETNLRQQMAGLETSAGEKNRRLEEMVRDAEAQRANFEEKLLHLQMASNTQKGRDEGKDKDLQVARRHAEKLAAQLVALTQVNEEKDMSVRSNKEMISALQARLIELEPELAQARERVKEVEKHSGASAMMRVEQDALLAGLRKDLRLTLEERDEATRRLKELEEFRVKAEGQLLHMAALAEQVTVLQTSVEDKTSFITRLRSEAQTGERNHAMRTAMLATCEAQLETLQQELSTKSAANLEVVERVTELQASVVASEARLAERVQEASAQMQALEKQSSEAEQAHQLTVKTMRAQHEEALEALKRDHARKSSMARTLLSEREEDVRLLTAKVAEQHDEITSGAPSERKIFELAQSQAKREATHGMHRCESLIHKSSKLFSFIFNYSDTREVAFQQLQTALASKDLELARNQQSMSRLTAEVLELRRTHQRDGINMDYLKNIVIQYMTLPVQSSEKLSLVRVLATLLQFTPNELAAVMKSDREPVWGSKPAKEVKRYVGPPTVSSSGSRPPAHNVSSHNGASHSSSGGSRPTVLPPVSVIVGVEGSLELGGVGGYTPPLNNSNSSLMTSTDTATNSECPLHRPLSRHLEMSQSDYDFREKMQILETMDVLNMSSSDPDLSVAAGNSTNNGYTPRRYPSTPGGGLANVGTVSQEI
jgi:chromosome segregation ATPase